MPKYSIIVNPISGRGAGEKSVPAFRQYLESQGMDYDLLLTQRPGHAIQLAARASSDGCAAVVGVGGDGTANEIIWERPVMKIAVCLKQVPSRDWQPRVNDQKTWVRDQDATFELNEPDAYALEEGLRLKEKHGGEVVVCSVGPARVSQALREALARGADRAIHVEDEALATAEAYAVAEALAAAMRDEAFDLVLTGLQSDDQGSAQTGVMLAALLGIASATIIMEVDVQAPGLRVKRELDGGWFQWVSMPMPALLTIQSGINQLRYATLKGIMAAKKKVIRRLAMPAGLSARQKIVNLYFPEKSKQTRMISGSTAEAAKELVRVLREEARVF